MGDQLLNGVITIKEVGLEDKRLKITAEGGKIYSIWRTKKDGTETKAFQFFSPMALTAGGKSFEIGYDERENPQNAGTFFRSIKVIKPADDLAIAKQSITTNQPVQITTQVSTDEIVKRLERLEQVVFNTPISSQVDEKPKEVALDDINF